MKKLIFCFDGTCNDPSDSGDYFSDSSISNVLKLHALFGGSLSPKNAANKDIKGQRSFYYSGVGTRGGWLRQKFNAALAPADQDIEEILDEAKKDLKKHCKNGDEIYIFGFSRGAAIARMFAAKHVDSRKVRFLGVFDTVAATKGSLDLKKGTYPASGIVFENGTLGRHVQEAVHLVSIDEKRLAFQPTLFNHDKKRITEIWFAGVHSDIGGGYWFDGLSDITLDFMCGRAAAAGLQVLKPSQIKYKTLKDTDKEYKDAEDAICNDDIAILPLANGVLHEQQRGGVAAKILAPRLVRINVKDQPSKDNIPILHHTVCERFYQVSGYRPYALRNRKFRVMDSHGQVSGVYTGIEGLRRCKPE